MVRLCLYTAHGKVTNVPTAVAAKGPDSGSPLPVGALPAREIGESPHLRRYLMTILGGLQLQPPFLQWLRGAIGSNLSISNATCPNSSSSRYQHQASEPSRC